MKHIRLELSSAGIAKAKEEINEYRERLRQKNEEFVQRLAERGAILTNMRLSNCITSADDDPGSADVETVSESPTNVEMRIKVSGKSILFIEFGTGIRYAGAHPTGLYGPGTYPGKGHWDDPNGWRFKDNSGTLHHTYGLPTQMPVYQSAQDLKNDVVEIAREVFGSD